METIIFCCNVENTGLYNCDLLRRKFYVIPTLLVDEMKQKTFRAQKKVTGHFGRLKRARWAVIFAANVQEVEDDEVSQDMIARIKTDLEKIGKALSKIQAGTYGTDDEGKRVSVNPG